ncbi:MAG: ATPase, T2SS/T4P/T4SS family [Candidatus Omnitrophota bacterium]
MADKERKKLGEILLGSGLITSQQLSEALEIQKTTDKRLGNIIIEKGILTGKQIYAALGYQLGIPFVDLKTLSLDPDIVKLIPKKIAEQHLLIAVNLEEDILTVASSDPLDLLAVDDIKATTRYEVKPVIALEEDIKDSIEKYYSLEKHIYESIKNIKLDKYKEVSQEKGEAALDTLTGVEDAPVVELLNHILMTAAGERASDIHIEPTESYLKVRFRIDGILFDKFTFPKYLQQVLMSRIKIISKLDIAEKRRPQDGRCRFIVGTKTVDARIATLPLLYGEKIVIRLLDKTVAPLRLEALGMTAEVFRNMIALLKSNKGLLFVTGPTGSGKTTTLYAAIDYMKSAEKNIVTIEDPIEYEIEGVNQMQINEKAGIIFSTGLRSILRQDPDIILVGEVRDKDTAEIAFEAALTGRLVLSTLHTNDASSAIIRLIKLGVKPFLVGEIVIGVIAQRLVRMICSNCKTEQKLEEGILNLLRIKTGELKEKKLFYGKGCKECNFTGYKGRTAIFEILKMDRKIAGQIDANLTSETMYNISRFSGMKTLMENGLDLVFNGITSVEEILKVTYAEKEKFYLCPNCRRQIEENFAACPYCGKELEQSICGVCGKPQSIEWQICPYCKTGRK